MASPGQKVVLITGCSSGIGLRMAVMLAKDPQKRFHGRCFENRLHGKTVWVRLPGLFATIQLQQKYFKKNIILNGFFFYLLTLC